MAVRRPTIVPVSTPPGGRSSPRSRRFPRPDHEGTYEAAVEVLTAIRGTKTKAQKSLRWPVARLEISGPDEHRDALAPVLEDVLRAGNVDADVVTVSDGASPEGQRFEVVGRARGGDAGDANPEVDLTSPTSASPGSFLARI